MGMGTEASGVSVWISTAVLPHQRQLASPAVAAATLTWPVVVALVESVAPSQPVGCAIVVI